MWKQTKKSQFKKENNSLSIEDIENVSQELEKAVKTYRLTCESLIRDFENKYDFSFEKNGKPFSLIEDNLKKDDYKLSKEWSYYFHGGDVRFYNDKTEQVVEVNLKYEGYYGVLDFWFLQCFIKTTNEFKSLNKFFDDNTSLLVKVLNSLKDKEKLESVRSIFYEMGEEDRLIWRRIGN